MRLSLPASAPRGVAWRTLVALPLGAALAVLGLAAARSYGALCAGPLSTYPTIAAARDDAQREASAAAPASATAARATVQARTLQLVLSVKQSDYVAFPAHVLAGFGLEVGGCPVAATGDQWRKAASHAWSGWPARIAAAGLARTMGSARGPEPTIASLQAYAAAEPWHAENLHRVEAAYMQLARSERGTAPLTTAAMRRPESKA